MELGFYFGLILSLVLICFSIKYPNSKKIFYTWFIWLFILFAFSSNNADYNMYINNYNEFGTKLQFGNYFLFKLVCFVFYNIKFSYRIFLVVYSLVGLLLIFSVIKKYSKKINYSLILYFFMPFVFDFIQLKNFMAFSIIIYALPYLFDNNKKSILKYLLLNIIASLFHPFAILGISFIVLNKINNKKFNIFLSIMFVLEGIFVISGLFVKLASLILPNDKFIAYFVYDRYIPGISTTLKSIIIIVLQIVILFICKSHNKEDKMNDIVYKMNKAYILFIPILFYTNQIMRLPKSLLIYVYMSITNIFEKINNLAKVVLISLVIMLIFVYWHSDIISINNMENTVIPLFNDNILLNYLF